MSYDSAFVGQADYKDAKIAVRIMILRAKAINDQELLFDEMPTDTLLRFGAQAAASPNGATNFAGFPLDSFREINRDTFAVRYDKVFYLDAPVVLPGSSAPDVSVVPSRSRMFKHRLTFGKNGLKLKYSVQADNNPNNFPYFMVVGYSSMSSTVKPQDNLIKMTLSSVGTYTDA